MWTAVVGWVKRRWSAGALKRFEPDGEEDRSRGLLAGVGMSSVVASGRLVVVLRPPSDKTADGKHSEEHFPS